ncbi:RNA-directed DNA polymerase, eukaryota, nucleotide-binding alpha-beta plait domain protein [Tanacetum coccineum]
MGTRRSKEDDWTEVTRKNRGYRTKEDDLVKVHSNADLTRTISKSIFVTNFPDNTTSADLWNICQTYGVVVDVYIPNRRSKVGKRFAFVRFIKVTNVERLVGNLCTLWIGRMHLHANVVRFERTPFQQSQPPPPTRPGKIAPSFVSAVKGILPTPVLSPPTMVLDDSCMVTTDLRNYVMGEVKLFSSVNNFRVILSAEGFSIQKVVYLGGLWVMFELPSANSKSKFLAHVGVRSWFKSLSNPQPDFSPRDRIIWVDVEGVPMHAWSSNIRIWGNEGLKKPIHQDNVEEESDIEAVSETFFGDQADDLNEVVDSAQQSIPKENSHDPFNIYDILNKENKDVNAAATNSSIPFPPGFTPDKPILSNEQGYAQNDQFPPDVKSVGSRLHILGRVQTIFDDQFSYWETMGFSMEGSIKDMERIIDLKGADDHSLINRWNGDAVSWDILMKSKRELRNDGVPLPTYHSPSDYRTADLQVPKAVLKSMESIRRNFFNGIRDGEKKIAWVLEVLSSIIKECNALKSQGLDLISHCKIKVGNGMSTSFVIYNGRCDSCLRLSYPRLFALENNKVCSVAAKMSAPFVSSLRRDVRGGEESAQLSRISDLLDTVGCFLTWGIVVLGPLMRQGSFRVNDVSN